MLLRLVDALDVAPLLGVQVAMDVLLEDLEVAGDCVQRGPELVTQAREELRLDPIRGFGVLSRRLLTLERELELTRALRDAGVERTIQRLHALLGIAPRGHVAEQPAERALAVGAGLQGRDGG